MNDGLRLDECGCSWKADHLYNLHMQYQGKERQIPEPILIHTKHRHSVQRSSVQTSHIVRKAGDRECCARRNQGLLTVGALHMKVVFAAHS